MAKLVFGMNQSLDGYVDHLEFAVGPGATRLRGGVAEPTEVGRIALAEVTRPQRHTCRG
jgi:hypothetical protein